MPTATIELKLNNLGQPKTFDAEGKESTTWQPIMFTTEAVLSSAPLTDNQIELGKKIARKHGLTK